MSDDGDRLALFVAAEFEEPVRVPDSKPGVEWLHLAKAQADLEQADRGGLSGEPTFGDDPPDFRVKQAGGSVAVELAQFTQSTRRSALALLQAVKRAVIMAPRERFRHLRDRLVFVGFEDPRGLPPRANDRAAIDRTLVALEELDPGPSPVSSAEATATDGFAVQIWNVRVGEGSAAAFPLSVLPRTTLADSRGFEIAASFTVVLRARDTEAELARLVKAHDDQQNDLLLISAGAPGRADGLALISEEIAVEPWILRSIHIPKPTHIKRIILHRWSHGDAFELHPTYMPLTEIVERGGPHVMAVGQAPERIWTATCPCGGGREFRDCHGTTGGGGRQ